MGECDGFCLGHRCMWLYRDLSDLLPGDVVLMDGDDFALSTAKNDGCAIVVSCKADGPGEYLLQLDRHDSTVRRYANRGLLIVHRPEPAATLETVTATPPAPWQVAEQIADLLPRGVHVYQVEMIARCGAGQRAAHIARAEIGYGSRRVEISGSGGDAASAVVDLRNVAARFEVTP